MRDVTREPMRPSEELKNESEMTFDLFGLSLSHRSIRDGDTTQADASSSKNPTAPPSKRRRFNSEWAEEPRMVALVPGLPRFDLPFAFTIIHGIGISTNIKTGKAWEHSSRV